MWPRSSSKRSNSTYLGNRLANSSQSTISRTASASTESHSERRSHKKFEMKSRPCFVTFLFLRLSILHSHITIPVSFLLNAYRQRWHLLTSSGIGLKHTFILLALYFNWCTVTTRSVSCHICVSCLFVFLFTYIGRIDCKWWLVDLESSPA